MKDKNNQYILLLLCILLIFVLLIKNKEGFIDSSDDEKEMKEWLENDKQKYEKERKELFDFVKKEGISFKGSLANTRDIDSDKVDKLGLIKSFNYNDKVSNEKLNQLKRDLRINSQSSQHIHFTYKLKEDQDGDYGDYTIYYASLLISIDPENNSNHRVASQKLIINKPAKVLPNVNLVPDNDKEYKKFENEFDRRIGPFPDSSECVIS